MYDPALFLPACVVCAPSASVTPPCATTPRYMVQAIYVHQENEKQLANRLQGEFDSRYGGPWHCIVGRYVRGDKRVWRACGTDGGVEQGGEASGMGRRGVWGGGERVQQQSCD